MPTLWSAETGMLNGPLWDAAWRDASPAVGEQRDPRRRQKTSRPNPSSRFPLTRPAQVRSQRTGCLLRRFRGLDLAGIRCTSTSRPLSENKCRPFRIKIDRDMLFLQEFYLGFD